VPPIHPYELAPGQAYDSSLETVLLFPINELVTIPDYLVKGQEDVSRIVGQHLQAQGLKVERPEAEAFRRAARRAYDSARRKSMSLSGDNVISEPTLSDIVPGIVEILKSTADLVVLQNMTVRSGEAIGHSLRWDGVSRKIPSTQRMGSWSGTFEAASLHLEVFKADGTKVFAGYGGLDLLWGANIRASRMVLMDDRLEDEANLREGVCVAFYPYFGEGRVCRGIPLLGNERDVGVVDKGT